VKLTKEQKQKLCEAVGFRSGTSDSFLRGFHKYPNDSIHSSLPDLSLDVLDKWFLPVVDGYVMFTGEGGVHVILSKDGLNCEVTDETLAEAQQGALYKLLVEGKNG